MLSLPLPLSLSLSLVMLNCFTQAIGDWSREACFPRRVPGYRHCALEASQGCGPGRFGRERVLFHGVHGGGSGSADEGCRGRQKKKKKKNTKKIRKKKKKEEDEEEE